MEMGIAIFLGAFLIGIGALAYYRIDKDFKEGNKKKASEALGCERTTFLKKCKRYEIE